MKRPVLVIWWIICVAATFAGARHLTAWFISLPFDMPYGIDMAIRFGFKLLLNDDAPDPDDMGDIALLIYFACAMLIAGAIVGFAGTLIWRRILSQRLR